MPFGHWADFEDCVSDMQAKQGYDVETARATCGKLQAEMGGGQNFVDYKLDERGDLFLKYFFADSTFAHKHPLDPTVGFSLNGGAIAQADKEAIGLPFTILPSRELSVFGDYHPWHPDLGKATLRDHIEFARRFSPGEIVAITPHSQLGGAQDIVKNGGRFAIVKITDQRTRDAYVNNPELIPKAVSPGFLNDDAPNTNDIKRVTWAHLAAVPQGAYGPKATVYATCLGKDECINKLVGASILQKAKSVNYCPVGASESIYNTSLDNFRSNSLDSNLDSTINTNPTQTPVSSPTQQQTQPQTTTTTAPEQKLAQQGAPLKPEEQLAKKPLLRLKTAQPQGEPQQPAAGIDQTKFDMMEKRLAEMEQREQAVQRRTQLRNLIDARAFIYGGKYNAKEHETAIEEAANSNWDDETVKKYYDMVIRYKELEEKQNPTNKRQINPLGGSQVYTSPSSVPEGGSIADIDIATLQTQKVKGLWEMFGVSR